MNELAIAIQAKIPVLLWGAPGTGKTSAIKSIAKQLNLPLEIVIASIREPSDFAGLPVVRDDGVVMEPPAWAKRLVKAGKGILFLDEISTAPPAVQAALLRVVLDRTVGNLELPDDVMIVAAANPPEQAAGGWELTPPLANRFCHLDWHINAKQWIEGTLYGWQQTNVKQLNPDWVKNIPEARALIASFIQHRPYLLLQAPTDDSKAGKAWPSPRSWDMAAMLLAAAKQADYDTQARLVTGCVGEGAGFEFMAWQRDLDLPDPEYILAHPKEFKLPDRGDKQFALLNSIASAVVNDINVKRWKAAWEILASASKQGGKDVAITAARTLSSIDTKKYRLPLQEEALNEFIDILQKGMLL